ncbi:uncharacterized protein CCOS01_15716 [Colletotrichum costaricense]|uniref:Glycoside hydrolase 131 catalytic N-terminal domain-containing protein n=1 Tax=Colletotrichum costaricense TaxID=1209916 RepID=A0AAI9YHH1_9PEZI|nr:uncharacterized protein CCOS01_15716 [Colletotrichum costaricense]KAK1509200.1 hypothetical protein CCOS01_15716 [Colletotrichum costaricense]
MKFTWSIASAALLATRAQCEILWDGRFNDMTSATDLDKWSWSSQVGPYQYYIHGSGATTDYVNLSSDFKNPADTGSKQGAKISLTSTSFWNGQTMRRTELIPQTTAAIGKGKLFYHFSLKRSDTNAPSLNKEHQIAFFESHFVEMKSGWQSGATGTEDPLLRWVVGGKTEWSVNWDADVWHNVAYEIDFDGGSVGFWHSTGAEALTQVVAPVTASASSNGADWHVGVLELPRDGYADETEDFYFSGVYIENGEITKAVGSGSSDTGSSAPASSAAPAATSAAAASSSAPAAAAPTTAAPTTTTVPTTSAAPVSSAAPVESEPASSSAPVATPVSSAAPVVSEEPSAPAATTPAAATTSSAPAASASAKPACRRRRRRNHAKRN